MEQIELSLAELRCIQPSATFLPSIFDEAALEVRHDWSGIRIALTSPSFEGLLHSRAYQLAEFAMQPLDSTPARPLSLLVVEDNRDVAESLAVVMRNCGYNVSVAYDGTQALQMIEVSVYNVILCDIGLPGCSGYEVASHVRRLRGKEPLMVAVSGYAVESVKDSARNARILTAFSRNPLTQSSWSDCFGNVSGPRPLPTSRHKPFHESGMLLRSASAIFDTADSKLATRY